MTKISILKNILLFNFYVMGKLYAVESDTFILKICIKISKHLHIEKQSSHTKTYAIYEEFYE